MKYTSKKIYSKRRKKRRKAKRLLLFALLIIAVGILWGYSKKSKNTSLVSGETLQYSKTSHQKSFLVDDLCVATDDVDSEYFDTDEDFHSIALMDVNNKEVLYAEYIH